MGTKLTQDDFVERSLLKHNNKYNYDKSVYQGSFTNVTIICPVHGDFEQNAASHIRGAGCGKCAHDLKRDSKDDFISKAVEIHGNDYDYSKVEYKIALARVIIICPIHGEWLQTPANHLSGKGCSSCKKTGFNKSKDAVLYINKVFYNEELIGYKVGITNRTVESRLCDLNRNNSAKFECILRFYSDGHTVYDLETAIHKKCQMIKGLKDIIPDGYTEIIHTDDLIIAFNMLLEAIKLN